MGGPTGGEDTYQPSNDGGGGGGGGGEGGGACGGEVEEEEEERELAAMAAGDKRRRKRGAALCTVVAAGRRASVDGWDPPSPTWLPLVVSAAHLSDTPPSPSLPHRRALQAAAAAA